ncbi:MAG: DUF418 domain-containing protein [Bacteroidaceae bacterium]|nr:DUF418 domain-containing protein [Bacteroidaceae bacterium]
MESSLQSTRINVVDCLRGFAVCGIIIIHFLEHMNFYNFPEPTALDQGIWDTVFFLGASKMYAIFALLFGFSCYIQHHNAQKRGSDFRGRFAWRMFLLFIWGIIDLFFYNGDILCTYAVIGLLLIPLVKAPDKVLVALAIFLFLQPVEIAYGIIGALNPSVPPMDVGIGPLWATLSDVCAGGSLMDVGHAGVRYGLQINFGWALENGRLTQTYLLFIIGMLIGRRRLFLDEGGNLETWKRILVASIISFAVFFPLWKIVPGLVGNKTVAHSLDVQLNMWRNFSMMAFYVSGIVLLYYRTRAQRAISRLAAIGKMSLTDYLFQSIVGGFLFYNWGLGLYRVSGHTMSFCIAIAFLFVLYFLCRWWVSNHRRGPLEEVWARLTHLGSKH